MLSSYHKTSTQTKNKFLEVMDKFITLTVVMVTLVYAYVQTCQFVYLNYKQFLQTDYTSIQLI